MSTEVFTRFCSVQFHGPSSDSCDGFVRVSETAWAKCACDCHKPETEDFESDGIVVSGRRP